ncbi:hypothetical protein [uncultured Paraglaciecola sp.]|uniref:hypothetical protein n=1 Tax=uncultured Paraglaciecola sp. TaxID=1765024 RepID=UPI002610741C|nr:hypothetical protein [uncultured Paraglaciecola sp.]
MMIDTSKDIVSASEFLNGQRCCLNNEQCPINASEDFQRGYAVEYERAEIATHQSMNASRQ